MSIRNIWMPLRQSTSLLDHQYSQFRMFLWMHHCWTHHGKDWSKKDPTLHHYSMVWIGLPVHIFSQQCWDDIHWKVRLSNWQRDVQILSIFESLIISNGIIFSLVGGRFNLLTDCRTDHLKLGHFLLGSFGPWVFFFAF